MAISVNSRDCMTSSIVFGPKLETVDACDHRRFDHITDFFCRSEALARDVVIDGKTIRTLLICDVPKTVGNLPVCDPVGLLHLLEHNISKALIGRLFFIFHGVGPNKESLVVSVERLIALLRYEKTREEGSPESAPWAIGLERYIIQCLRAVLDGIMHVRTTKNGGAQLDPGGYRLGLLKHFQFATSKRPDCQTHDLLIVPNTDELAAEAPGDVGGAGGGGGGGPRGRGSRGGGGARADTRIGGGGEGGGRVAMAEEEEEDDEDVEDDEVDEEEGRGGGGSSKRSKKTSTGNQAGGAGGAKRNVRGK